MSDSCDPKDYSPQASLSMGFPRQEYWNELPFPIQGYFPDPEIKAGSPALQENSLPLSHWDIVSGQASSLAHNSYSVNTINCEEQTIVGGLLQQTPPERQ